MRASGNGRLRDATPVALLRGRRQESRMIAKQTRHKSLPVLRGYIRERSLFTENAAKVGL